MSRKFDFLELWVLSLAGILAVEFAEAGSGTIDAAVFEGEGTIVFTETFECENRIYGLAVKNEDWSFRISGKGAVLLDTDTVEEFWALRALPKYESALYQDGGEPTEAEIKNAQEKDAAHERKVRAALAAEHKRAGLKPDPKTERIVYFFSGEAKMRVIECLHGLAKPGDVIDVNWKHILRKTSCPPVIPFKGECGWILAGGIRNGSKTPLGHGFFSLEEAKKAKAEHQKRSEEPVAIQPAAAVESKSEVEEKSEPESKVRSR